MVGKQIGPYKIVSKLGSGGMATVYRAFDTSLERSVALKLLHRGATVAGAARFREEAKAAARFPVHPNIVAIYQVLDTDFGPCIVMEHVDGYTLRQRIQDLSIADSIRIVKEVAAALALAHSVDMVHRDIKPENVILATGGNACHKKYTKDENAAHRNWAAHDNGYSALHVARTDARRETHHTLRHFFAR